jgi:hypothetical protein
MTFVARETLSPTVCTFLLPFLINPHPHMRSVKRYCHNLPNHMPFCPLYLLHYTPVYPPPLPIT